MCRAAPALLAHCNLLLAAFGGAALATGARLKWDPTTYVALRELLPDVYHAAAAGVPAAGAALLALAHLALLALAATRTRTRRALLLAYAAGMALAVVLEVCACVWVARRVAEWLASDEKRDMMAETAELSEHLRPLFASLARWHPLIEKFKDLIDEAEADGPRNAYVAAACGVAALLLQLAALALALLERAQLPRAAHHASPKMSNGHELLQPMMR